MELTATEWIIIVWYYLRNVVGPIVVFVLAVVLVVMVARMNGRLKRALRAGATPVPAGDGEAGGHPSASTEGRPSRDQIANAPGTVAEERDRLVRELERARRATDLADRGLTRRERDVLLASCEGRTLATLAEELGVSRSTVGTYCTRAYEKLGVSSREEARTWLARRTFAHRLEDAGLSEGEIETALRAADGASTAEIAGELVLSEAAVKSRLQQVYAKLGIHGRDELARMRDAVSAR